MVEIGEKFRDQHERITDLEFEIIELVSGREPPEFSGKPEKLRSLYEVHIGFEETELFPLVRDKVPEKVLDHIRDEHGEIYEGVKNLESLAEEGFEPLKLMNALAELRGTHTSHIHLEREYFYPVLDALSSSEGEEIMERFEEQSFESYVPLNKRG